MISDHIAEGVVIPAILLSIYEERCAGGRACRCVRAAGRGVLAGIAVCFQVVHLKIGKLEVVVVYISGTPRVERVMG